MILILVSDTEMENFSLIILVHGIEMMHFSRSDA